MVWNVCGTNTMMIGSQNLMFSTCVVMQEVFIWDVYGMDMVILEPSSHMLVLDLFLECSLVMCHELIMITMYLSWIFEWKVANGKLDCVCNFWLDWMVNSRISKC